MNTRRMYQSVRWLLTTGLLLTMVLTLAGTALTNLFDLVESGRLVTGDKALPARVTLLAHAPSASENGPTAGGFTLSRSGAAQGALAVNLQITGSAANGVDYVFINSQASFLPGERSLMIEVTPYIDAITELSEVVQISVQPGDGYTLGATATAQVSIEDLLPQIAIETLEPVAVKSDQAAGVFLVTRAGVLDRSVLVRLNVEGTASSSDYSGVSSFVNLSAGQTTAIISVTPRSTAVLANGVEYVQISIRPDAAYRVALPSSARVLLVDEQLNFGLWRDRFFAGATGDLFAFASEDPGQTGTRTLQRYAFGLDAHAPQQSPGKPLFQFRDGHLTVEFRRPASVADVQYAVEISEDLVAWHSGDGYVEPFTAPELANQPETLCYGVKRSISQSQTMFMRVRVIYAP